MDRCWNTSSNSTRAGCQTDRRQGGQLEGKTDESLGEMQQMTLFERFITEGNEEADEQATEGARLDGGDVAQVRAVTIQQEREEVYAAFQHTAGFHCPVQRKDGEELRPKPNEKWFFVNKKGKQRSIERSGARQQTKIGVRDTEEAADT